MHKLAKGLKKKKKPKKGKKGAEEEEFDPEELERYRRERAEAQEKAAAEAASAGDENSEAAASGPGGSDEWRKFEALAAGVDSILRKTQGDLDRIKSTSFFQRKAPIEDQKRKKRKEAEEEEARVKARRWVGFDKAGNPVERDADDAGQDGGEEARRRADGEGGVPGVSEEGFVDVPEDEDDPEDSADEDVFDTTYVDVLRNIDVRLAYIPDSPTEEENADDPFDTTSADKVLGTVDKKGNRLVSLGNAVEVLSGRVDHASSCRISTVRRPRTRDLLLDDFEDGENLPEDGVAVEEPEIRRTLLDDDTDLPDAPVDPTRLPSVLPRPVPSKVNDRVDAKVDAKVEELPLDISEFEILKERSLLEEIPDLDDEEFELVASVNGSVGLEEVNDPFGAKETGEGSFEARIVEEASFAAASFANEEDPFDTTFAENILPGKAELRFIERELQELPSTGVSISLTDPSGLKRDYETGFLSSDPSSDSNADRKSRDQEDLLGGSCADLAGLSDQPIAPVEREITYVDPFDTSAVQELPPGRTELKFLERELLGEEKRVDESLQDDDFDPRKEEKPARAAAPPRPRAPAPCGPVSVTAPSVGAKFNEERASTVDGTLGGRKASTVDETPSLFGRKASTVDESPSLGGKKTSTVDESPSLGGKKTSTVDETPSLGGKKTSTVDESPSLGGKKTSTVDETPSLGGKKTSTVDETPSLGGKKASTVDESPSLVGRKASRPEVLGLGAAKSVAFELPTPSRRPDLLQTSDEEKSISSKPLTPYYSQKSLEDALPEEANVEEVDVDPFDTSFVGKVAPGRTELRLIESALLTKGESRLKHSSSEHDFDPRSGTPGGEPERTRRRSDFGASSPRPRTLGGVEPVGSLSEECEATPGPTGFEATSRPTGFEAKETLRGEVRAKRRQESLLDAEVEATPGPTVFEATPRPTAFEATPRPTAFETNETLRGEVGAKRRQESLLDAEVEVDAKALTPRIESRFSQEAEISYVDPFDTSIAANLPPGRAELKLLENELSRLPTEVQRARKDPIDFHRVSARPTSVDDEDDFDPRAGEAKHSRDFLCLDGHHSGDKLLTPLNDRASLPEDEVDPFDTSFASVGPGKTELRLLESEFVDK